jgi:hypothetical protein
MRRPRIELGSTAWKATMLTITPATLSDISEYIIFSTQKEFFSPINRDFYHCSKKTCVAWESNSDQQRFVICKSIHFLVLPTCFLTLKIKIFATVLKKHASPENRTRINCLEGNYADHYTSNASYYDRVYIF